MLILALAAPAVRCGGTKNIADCAASRIKAIPCSQRTPEEQARLDLEQGNWDEAITLLSQLITDEPATYSRYPLLAAAYAARSGLNVLDVAKAQFSGGSGLLDIVTAFIPNPAQKGAAYPASLSDMRAAVTTLRSLPTAFLTTGADRYAASAVQQLSLYQSCYSVMYLNQFAISTTTGQIDLTKLKTMSEDDAAAIIANLIAAGQVPQSSGNAALQTKINATVAQIQGQPGSTQKDKIQAFVSAQKAAKSGASASTATATSTSSSTDTATSTASSTDTATGTATQTTTSTATSALAGD